MRSGKVLKPIRESVPVDSAKTIHPAAFAVRLERWRIARKCGGPRLESGRLPSISKGLPEEFKHTCRGNVPRLTEKIREISSIYLPSLGYNAGVLTELFTEA